MEPTPAQRVARTICGALADLPAADQARALEAVRVALGLNPEGLPRARQSTAQERGPQLPMVRVQMMGGSPRVVSDTDPPGAPLVVISRTPRPPRALQATTAARGFVRDVLARR